MLTIKLLEGNTGEPSLTWSGEDFMIPRSRDNTGDYTERKFLTAKETGVKTQLPG